MVKVLCSQSVRQSAIVFSQKAVLPILKHPD
jgi:hypothetical protein